MTALTASLRLVAHLFILGVCLGGGGVGLAVTGANEAPVEPSGPGAFVATLTATEQAWLREHPVIRVAMDPGWAPIEFADAQGAPSGMSWDYLALVAKRLDVRFEPIRNLSWQEAYARMQRWEIDMTASVAVTPERQTFWAFTKPYMRIPIVIVTRPDVTYIADLRELAGKRVAVVEGYAVTEWISRDYPRLELVQVNSTEAGMKALQQGRVFAYVENMLVIDYYIAQRKLTDLKIAGSTPYVNAQCLAVRKDWAPLAAILDKALDSISNDERDAIYRKWLPERYVHGPDYTWLWRALVFLAVIMLALVIWNRRLSREIRHRKHVEAALSHSRERLALATASARLGIWDWDAVADRLVWDARMFELFGVREQDAGSAAEVWAKSLHPEDREQTEANVQAALKRSSEFYSQFRIIWPNGEVRTIETHAVVQRGPDGSATRLIGTNCDITKRKHAEEALRASEQLIAGIINAIPVRVFWKDRNLTYLGCNAAFTRDAGYDDPQDIIGKDDFQLGWRAQAEAYRADDRQVIDSGVPKYFIEESQTTPDGKIISLLTSKLPLRDARGQIRGVLGTYMDITARKQVEEALRESLREKDALLKEVHHRVKNNLQVIMSLLRLEAARHQNPAVLMPLREMQGRIRSMALLHETVYRSNNLARVDLAAYLHQVATQLFRVQNTAPNNVKLTLELDAVIVAIDHAVPCGLIVTELITNSLKHGFPDRRAGEVRLRLQQDARGMVQVSVSDTGVGLPAGFDLKQATSLGLRIVADLAGQLLGTLTIAPGASFTIAFTPAGGAEPDTQSPTSAAENDGHAQAPAVTR